MQPAEQRLLWPNSSFTCGGSVSGWTVGLQRVQEVTARCLELQVWRSETLKQFQIQASTSVCADDLIPTAQGNIYIVTPTDQVRFEQGDYFGLYQPPQTSDEHPVLAVHYVASDRMNLVISSDTSETFHDLENPFLPLLEGCVNSPLTSCSTPLVSARVGEQGPCMTVVHMTRLRVFILHRV